MVEYNTENAKLSNSQLNQLKCQKQTGNNVNNKC